MQESQFSLGLGAAPILLGSQLGAVPGPPPLVGPSVAPERLGLLSLTPFQKEVVSALLQLDRTFKPPGR